MVYAPKGLWGSAQGFNAANHPTKMGRPEWAKAHVGQISRILLPLKGMRRPVWQSSKPLSERTLLGQWRAIKLQHLYVCYTTLDLAPIQGASSRGYGLDRGVACRLRGRPQGLPGSSAARAPTSLVRRERMRPSTCRLLPWESHRPATNVTIGCGHSLLLSIIQTFRVHQKRTANISNSRTSTNHLGPLARYWVIYSFCSRTNHHDST